MIKTVNIFILLCCLGFSAIFNAELVAQPIYAHNGKIYTSLQDALNSPDDVERLKLRRNRFKQFPKEIFQFKNLVELDLTGNRITEIPDSIYRLENLTYLNLERNQITALPNGIGKMQKLRYLNIGKNRIDSLNAALSNVNTLEFIQAWGNGITDVPDDFYKLKNLKYLDLRAIIITDDQREEIVKVLPKTFVYFSPSCNCKN